MPLEDSLGDGHDPIFQNQDSIKDSGRLQETMKPRDKRLGVIRINEPKLTVETCYRKNIDFTSLIWSNRDSKTLRVCDV